jgi:hypothetical protein
VTVAFASTRLTQHPKGEQIMKRSIPLVATLTLLFFLVAFAAARLHLEPGAQATQTKTTIRKGPRKANQAHSVVPGFRVENPRLDSNDDGATWITIYNDTDRDARAINVEVDFAGGNVSKAPYKLDGSALIPAHGAYDLLLETDNVSDNGIIELRAVSFMDGTSAGTANAIKRMDERTHEKLDVPNKH